MVINRCFIYYFKDNIIFTNFQQSKSYFIFIMTEVNKPILNIYIIIWTITCKTLMVIK